MGKLSYINRKSEGVKLGQIVAKDLRKRVKPTCPPSRGDAHKDLSMFELNLEGKSLTDAGLDEVANGLEDALQVSEGNTSTKLQVLNISRNGLTARSLAKLAKSIKQAGGDLQDVDVSGNGISVHNDDDAHYWETFLRALGSCRMLKRLNLAGNDLSGPRAFEIFARTWAQQFHKHEARLDQYFVDDWADSAIDLLDVSENLSSLSIKTSNEQPSAPLLLQGYDQSKLAVQGLPAVESIVLANTSMTDAGALFLSFTLAQHTWVQSRLSGQLTKTFGGSGPIGMVYLPNDGLSSVGLKLLKQTQAVQHDPFEGIDAPFGPENSPVGRTDSITGTQPRRVSAQHQRKISTSSHPTEDMSSKTPTHPQNSAKEDLASSRRKIQRTMLEADGPQSVELWSIALKLLAYTRRIMIEDRYQLDFPPLTNFAFPAHRQSEAGLLGTPPYPATPSSKIHRDPLDPTSPSCAINGLSDSPLTPHILNQPHRRRDSFSVGSDITPTSSHRHLGPRNAHLIMNPPRPRMIGPLPEAAWDVVVRELADPAGVLSERQRRAVVAWGKDRRTLAREAEGLGKPGSVQMWKVLDGMGCLAYEEVA